MDALMTEYDARFGTDVTLRFEAARTFAQQYCPRRVNGFVVHNPMFQPLTQLDRAAIADTFLQLNTQGTFAFQSHPQTGLVRTSDTLQSHMHRQWFTDSVMVGYWQREADPQGWQRSMLAQAAIINSKTVANVLAKVEQDPAWYRSGPISHGIFHLYQPDSLQLDAEQRVIPDSVTEDPEWHNRKRLESQAQLLWWLALTWQQTAEAWGFADDYRTGQPAATIMTAMQRLTRYLLAVTTHPVTGEPDFHTPSASSWEEYAFADGMTSDAGYIVLALEAVANLPDMAGLQADYANHLKPHIAAGRNYIDQRITQRLAQGLAPMQTSHRHADMSLTFLAASGYRFNQQDDVADVETRLGLVQSCLTQLTGDHGMRRFNHYTIEGVALFDNYLNYAGNFPRELFADHLGEQLDSGDYMAAGEEASSPQALMSRQKTSRFEYTAQWGLGLSASLQALVLCRQQVRHNAAPLALQQQVDTLLIEVYNRCIAAIPARQDDNQPLYRADGTLCPDFAAMEAYQVMPDKNGNPVWVPGAHTLPWHAAQLYDGLTQLLAQLA
jgi:hypothetical protein